MPTLKKTVVVQRPQQEVFDYLTQVSRHGEWSPKPWRVEGDPGALIQGSKFTSYGWVPGDKEHRNEVEVTESGTSVERTFEFPDPTGPIRMIFPTTGVLKLGAGQRSHPSPAWARCSSRINPSGRRPGEPATGIRSSRSTGRSGVATEPRDTSSIAAWTTRTRSWS
jgi:hypothetical protein